MPVKSSKSCSKRGPTGPRGNIGNTGVQGPIGIQGPIGPTGYGGDKYQTIISFTYKQKGALKDRLWTQDLLSNETTITTESNLSFVSGTKVVITPLPEIPVNGYFNLTDASKNEITEKQWHGTITYYNISTG